jgi:hypothetical protein
MRKFLLILFALAVTVSISAEKKDKFKDWKTGKVAVIKTQDMQSSSYSNPNGKDMTGNGAILPGASNAGSAGGSFSSAPAHFIVYNVGFETEEASYFLTLSREVTLRQPELKAESEYKFKQQGPKFVEIVDNTGRKFEFTIVRMAKKEATEPATPK